MIEGSISEVLGGAAGWTVIEGDCLEVLPTLPGKSVAHVITDPPYESEAHTLQRRVNRDMAPRDTPPTTGRDHSIERWKSNPSRLRQLPSPSGSWWQHSSDDWRSAGWSPSVRSRRR